jgi:hypothetical protein
MDSTCPPCFSYLTLKPYTYQLFEPYVSFLCHLLLIHQDLPHIILYSPQIFPLLCSEVPRISPSMARSVKAAFENACEIELEILFILCQLMD